MDEITDTVEVQPEVDFETKLKALNADLDAMKVTFAKLPDAVTASLRTGLLDSPELKRTSVEGMTEANPFVTKALAEGCRPRTLSHRKVYAEVKSYNPRTREEHIERREYGTEEKAYLFLIGKWMIAYAEHDRDECKRRAAEMWELAEAEGLRITRQTTKKQLTEGAAPGSLWIFTELLQTYLLAQDDYGRVSIFDQRTVSQDQGTLPYELLLPQFGWRGEGESKPVDEPTGTNLSWDLNWCACIALATRDLLDDAYAVDLAAYIMNVYLRGAEAELWSASAIGTGVGMPTGYSICAYVHTVNAAGGLMYQHLKRAWLSLVDASRKNERTYWFANDWGLDAMLDVIDLQNRPIFKIDPNSGNYPTPFGRPVQINNNIVSTAGSPVTTDIYLIDTRYYHVFRKRGSALRVQYADTGIVTVGSKEVNLFQENYVAWRFEDRLDMNCSNSAYRAEIENVSPMTPYT